MALLVALVAAGCGQSAAIHSSRLRASSPPATPTTGDTTQATGSRTALTAPTVRPHAPFRLAERVVTFVDHADTVRYPGRGPQPRRLVTIIRYPRAGGSFPLIVFGHGFAVTPAIYSALLSYWASRGYVVAAPVFPLGNAHAPGGPDERDLVNQPRDMSFVITQMIRADHTPASFLRGRLQPAKIAVAGQSDGGDTALSAAYNIHYRDRRIRAAVILSGAEIPGVSGYDFPAPSPPLLAIQGLADSINPPTMTYAFFDPAPQPKYLLTLPGASHLGPYTDEQPQLGIVERVSTEFLDLYLKGYSRDRIRMRRAGNVDGVAELRG